ncbi:hypothetical protein BHC44_09570 [Snodgrassella alvi]|nr:hypothetical protein BHC44_09570 [Snodgrassella alvi]
MELEMTGRKLYTVWYRNDFYIQIGIDWDYPGIKDQIVAVIKDSPIFYYKRDCPFETYLEIFLKSITHELSSCRINDKSLDHILVDICYETGLRFDGENGITLCKFEVPQWPHVYDFKITNVEECNNFQVINMEPHLYDHLHPDYIDSYY